MKNFLAVLPLAAAVVQAQVQQEGGEDSLTRPSEHHPRRPLFGHPSFLSTFFHPEDDLLNSAFPTYFLSTFLPEDATLARRHFFLSSPFDAMTRKDDDDEETALLQSHPIPDFPSTRSTFLRGRRGPFFEFLPSQPSEVHVVDDEKSFQVSLRLPEGIQAQDVKVYVEDGGTRLVIQGQTTCSEATGNGERTKTATTSTTSFSQSFPVDPRVVEVDWFEAKVMDGLLIVSAPKDERKIKNVNHPILVQDLNAVESMAPPDKDSTVDSSFQPLLAAKHALVDTRNHQMAKFTKLYPEGNEDDKVQTILPLSDPKSVTDGWKEVTETTL